MLLRTIALFEMQTLELRLIESVAVLVLYIVLKIISERSVNRAAIKFSYLPARVKIVKKLINISLFFICLGFILFIWGVQQSELLFFVTSLLTVLGVAFFAQWSIISNITSSLIIFFNHPAKIGDNVSILDKEFQIDGVVSDIGFFFIIIKTKEGEKVTIPNNVFTQKMVRRNP